MYKLKENDKAAFYSPAEEWVLPAASKKEPEEREFVVDSGASMHMVSKKDLNSAELETMRTSRSPMTVVAANGEVQTKEDATVFVKELDLFVTVMLLEETPAVLSLGKLCEESWENLPLDQRSKTTCHQKGQENWLQYTKQCAIRSPSFINEFLYNAHTNFFIIFITRFCIWRQPIRQKSSTRKRSKYEWGAAGKPDA